MFSFKSVYFVIFNLIIHQAQSEISDKRLCIDENCSEIVAFGKTLLRYSSPDRDILSFGPNEDVKIYSYGAGKNSELIGVELRGKRGYINKSHVRETRLVKRPKLLVDTELAKAKVPLEGTASDIKADKAQEFEIIDGTKIWLESTTEVPVTPNSVEEQSNIQTQPLKTVPENKNVNPSPEVLVENSKKPELNNKALEEDNDDEDDSDEDDDEEEEAEDPDNDEEVIKETDTNKINSDSLKNVESLVYFEETVQNTTTDDAPAIETNNKEDIVIKPLDLVPNTFSSELKEAPDTPANNTVAEPIKTVSAQITENPEDLNVKSVESIAEISNLSEPILNGSEVQSNSELKPLDTIEQEPAQINLLNLFDATVDKLPLVQSPQEQQDNLVTANNTEEKDATPTVLEPLQAVTTEIPLTANNTEEKDAPPTVLEIKESTPSQSDSSLPAPTTEVPLEIDISFPLESESVTPNPADTNNQQPEATVILSEFNNPEETVEVKIEEPAVESNQEALDLETNNIDDNDASVTSDLNSDALLTAEIEKNLQTEPTGGFLSDIMSFFGMGSKENQVSSPENNVFKEPEVSEIPDSPSPWSSDNTVEESLISKSVKYPEIAKQGFCDKENEDCAAVEEKVIVPQEEEFSAEYIQEIFIEIFSSDMFLYLFTTSVSVLILIFIWILLDKCRREGPLIARINKLEQQLLATSKENEMLHEKATLFVEEKTQLVVETVPNEVVDELNAKLVEANDIKLSLEEQIQALEKELDTSTEVGIELNKIISEMLNSTDGSEILKENVEQMQKKLLEQQDRINSLNDSLNIKEMEMNELRLELDISNKKATDLQLEVNKMVEKILRIEEERDHQHRTLESDIALYKNKCQEALTQEHVLKSEIIGLNQKLAELQRLADTKIKEYDTLKETIKTLKSVKNDKDAMKSFLDVSEVKAQVEQLKSENIRYSEQLSQERTANISYTAQIQTLSKDVQELREKYEKADKEKVETNTKLEVLNNYFKEKEDQMQKEISKYESLWVAKEGEATSTTERIRYMQEELQNYRAQNESLKQEIVNQEVELKSQISMLEKKSHENWMTNRQIERKLEEAKQEAALLRNRLTLRERALTEGHNQMRMQSPLHQNGELPLSPPPPLDPTQSPPPLFNPLDRMTKSPPIPGLPPPFLPRLGATPFIPPPPLDGMMPPPIGDIGGMPPFIPGLHSGMFPGDHRPPPLGRMSSPPPVGGRYTPESTVYSEYDRYDRRTPSPPYDSEYGASPPPIRGYSPYDDRDRVRDDRRVYKRPQPRSNGRNSKGIHSSGSENDSLGKVNNKKPQRKV